jgi:hypothetical protein
MKTKILYIAPFVLAFMIVTLGIIYLNSSYSNIFKLDFTPKSTTNALSDSTNTNTIDSLQVNNPHNKNLASVDSLTADSINASTQSEYLKADSTTANDPLDKTIGQKPIHSDGKTNVITKSNVGNNILKQDSSMANPFPQTITNNKSQKDTSYISWLKNVTSIYEVMEPKKAAKIIQNYSDNIARDILYTMKKKNAAKVVAELSPETANRIFRFE